jgi:tRNA A-37 threonylcarbamoyl transferase component Bud32
MHNFNLTTVEQKSSHDLRRPKTGLRPQQFLAWGVGVKNKNPFNDSSNSRSRINAKLSSQESELFGQKTMGKSIVNLSQEIAKPKGLFIDGLQELLKSKRDVPEEGSPPYSEPQKEATSGRNPSNFERINHNRHKSSKNLKKDDSVLSGNNPKNKASTNRQSNYFADYIKSQNEKFQSENNQRHTVLMESTYKKSKDAWENQKHKLLKKFENPKKINERGINNTDLFRDSRKSKDLGLTKNSSLKRIPVANTVDVLTLSELRKSAPFKDASSGLNSNKLLSKINHSYKKSTDLASLFNRHRKQSVTYQSNLLQNEPNKSQNQHEHNATHGDETDRSDVLVSDQKQRDVHETNIRAEGQITSHSAKRNLVNALRATPKSQSLKNQSLKLKFSLNNLLYKRNQSKNLEFNSSNINNDTSNSKSSQTLNHLMKMDDVTKSIGEGLPVSENRIMLNSLNVYHNEIKESNASNDESSRSSSKDDVGMERNYELLDIMATEPKSNRIEIVKNGTSNNLTSFRKKILNIEIDEVEFKKPANTQSQLTTPVTKNNRNAKSFMNLQTNFICPTKQWEKLRNKELTSKPFKLNMITAIPDLQKPCTSLPTHKPQHHEHPLTTKVKNFQHISQKTLSTRNQDKGHANKHAKYFGRPNPNLASEVATPTANISHFFSVNSSPSNCFKKKSELTRQFFISKLKDVVVIGNTSSNNPATYESPNCKDALEPIQEESKMKSESYAIAFESKQYLSKSSKKKNDPDHSSNTENLYKSRKRISMIERTNSKNKNAWSACKQIEQSDKKPLDKSKPVLTEFFKPNSFLRDLPNPIKNYTTKHLRRLSSNVNDFPVLFAQTNITCGSLRANPYHQLQKKLPTESKSGLQHDHSHKVIAVHTGQEPLSSNRANEANRSGDNINIESKKRKTYHGPENTSTDQAVPLGSRNVHKTSKAPKKVPREYVDIAVTEFGVHKEHEFNNVFKIINFLDQDQTLNKGRLAIREKLKKVKQRSKLNDGANSLPSHLAIDEKEFLTDFEVGEFIGEGSNAVVKIAVHKFCPEQEFAIKIYKRKFLDDALCRRNLEMEIEILSKIDHENIVKLHAAINAHHHFFLVMDYVSKISLFEFIEHQDNKRVSESFARAIFKQLVSAIHYLHCQDIVHRDIKLQNVLLTPDVHIKLIDFGYSVYNDSETKLHVFCGTPSYMAPEIVRRIPYDGKATDVWALGVVLYRILTGYFPFRAATEEELFAKIVTGQFEIPKFVSISAKGLLERIFCVDPLKRPLVSELLQSEWMAFELSKDTVSTAVVG